MCLHAARDTWWYNLYESIFLKTVFQLPVEKVPGTNAGMFHWHFLLVHHNGSPIITLIFYSSVFNT